MIHAPQRATEGRVPTQFECVIYIKSQSGLEDTAKRVFGALGGGAFEQDDDPALGGEYWRMSALGFEGTVFGNRGDMEDEDFEPYTYGLGVATTYLDPEIELAPAESPLAEYYARLLAFQLDLEVATSFYLGGQDGIDLYEIRAFRRNPQFTLDSGPMSQRVYITERRTVEYDAELVEDDFQDEAEAELDE
jgi:hypothetical protein